jgi:hypothetical protein
MRLFVAMLFVGLLAACGDDNDDGGGGGGGGGGGTNVTATGSVPIATNNGVTISGAAACPDLTPGDPPGIDESFSAAIVSIFVSNFTDTCSVIQAGDDKANSQGAQIVIARGVPGTGGTSVPTGTYQIGASGSFADFRFADVFIARSDAQCLLAGEAIALEGPGNTVTLTSFQNGRAIGTVDAALDTGGRVTGSFDAPACAVTLNLEDACAFDFLPPAGGTCRP